ncbi:hypothetical protein KUTeg_012297 [Tegillarca granosa]|uniref:Uncharacterized protein n=1 Tax=Tegillarca granosa TaxID=220873 RepID=A0ABQ9EZ36_TEGGR|nr:hypothetical protein KUTeg_012297 [Tegillarca granosa]
MPMWMHKDFHDLYPTLRATDSEFIPRNGNRNTAELSTKEYRSRMIVTETNGSLLRFIYVMLAANNTDNYSNSVQRKVLSLHNPSVPPKRPVANLFLDIKSSNQENIS